MNDELLLQVQDNGEQVRIVLTPDEAIHLRSLIDDALSKVRIPIPKTYEV